MPAGFVRSYDGVLRSGTTLVPAVSFEVMWSSEMVCSRLLLSASRICLKIIVFCMAGASVSLAACQIASIENAPATSTAKATQRGRVINSITGEPVAFALVQLPGIKPLRAMLTGADGSFEFANVPTMLEINARKPGFLGMGVSQEGEMGGTTQISSAGEPVTLALVPEAVIAGHVTDARGEPMEGVRIKIYHSRIVQGRRSWQGAAEDLTDDDGAFRAAELEAGQYYIAVHTDEGSAQFINVLQPKRSRRGYRAVIYYPDNRTDISALEIAAGQHIDVPIALSEEPVFQVSGRVAGGTAGDEMKINVVNDRGDELVSDTTIEGDGAFTINGLAAGTYTISFGLAKSATQLWLAETTIHVAGDVKGLQLHPFQAASIPVNLTTEFTNREFIWRGRFNLQASVWRVDKQNEAGRPNAQLTYDGNSLVLVNLTPGAYFVQFTTPLGYVASARCGSTDLLRENLIIRAGSALPPIEVVLRNDTGTLTGSTQGVDWTTVVVASDIPNVSPQTSQVPGHSSFSLSLAPGNYKVYAFSTRDEIEYANPAVLEQYASRATQVSVTPGSTASIKIDPIRVGN